MTVNVLLEDSFDGHQGNDLYDPEHAIYRVFRVRKQATVHEFLELLSDSLVSKLNKTVIKDRLLLVPLYTSRLIFTVYLYTSVFIYKSKKKNDTDV